MTSIYKTLGFTALSLALGGVLAGDFEHSDIAFKTQQIDTYQLATWIKDRRPMVLIDFRPRKDLLEFSLPGATDPANAVARLKSLQQQMDVVIYGHESHPDWQQTVFQNHHVHLLANGIEQWLATILNPVVYRHAPTKELALFQKHAELSRYFGGMLRYTDQPVKQLSATTQLAGMRRRGCGF